MATKKLAATPKIIDVSSPGQTAPSASSRPVVVTNRPILATDPMMAAQTAEAETPATAPAVTRQTKVITPLKGATEKETAVVPEETPPEATPVDDEPDKAPEGDEDTAVEGESEDPVSTEKIAVDEKRLAAEEARQQELEDVIASGKYTVPINVVQGGRSGLANFLVVLLILIVIAIVLDVLLDTKVLSLSVSIPHTHFFK